MPETPRTNRLRYSLLGLFAAGVIIPMLAAHPWTASKTVAPVPEVRGQPINPNSTDVGVGEPIAAKPAVAAATPATPTPASAEKDEYASVGFDKLSAFHFQTSDQLLNPPSDPDAARMAVNQQIPQTIRALNEKGVSIKGFMLPLKMEGGLVTDFLLLKNQNACCYGVPPKLNEQVSVHMAGKGVKPTMDVTIVARGTLHVGEMRENGFLVGIYNLDGDSVSVSEY